MTSPNGVAWPLIEEIPDRVADVRLVAGGLHRECPLHDGRRVRLDIGEDSAGRAVFDCAGGCSNEDVGHALGFSTSTPTVPASNGSTAPSRRRVQEPEAPEEWPAPIPVESSLARPPFPVDALGNRVRPLVDALAEELQVPADLPAVLALGLLGVALGGRVSVRAATNWTEPVQVFSAVILPPGEKKSPTLARLRAPLVAAETELRESMRPVVAKAEFEARLKRDRAEQLHRDAVKSEDVDTERQAQQAAWDAEEAQAAVPTLPVVSVDDATPEALLAKMAEQQGRIAVVSAEPGFLGTIAGRYSNGQAFLDAVNQGYDGEPIRSSRKGAPDLVIESARVSLVLAAQPGIVEALTRNNAALKAQGFLARFWWSMPRTRIGERATVTQPVPSAVQASWDDLVLTLVADRFATDAAHIELSLSDDAARIFGEYRSDLERRRRPNGDVASVAEWGAKADGRTLRIAALLHIAKLSLDGLSRSIDGPTMSAAVTMHEYLLAHTRATFDAFDAGSGAEDWRIAVVRALRAAVDDGETQVRWRDLSKHSNSIRTAEQGEEALTMLAAHGYVRPAPPPERRGRGNPGTQLYDIHPALLAERIAAG